MGSTPWIPISALNQYMYCPRRCGLIHQEQSFEDNVHTVQGNLMHELVDQAAGSSDPTGVDYALPLWSARYHIRGIADVVEWYDGVPFPVEYKKGRRKKWANDDIQLCAQALCLEEMLNLSVERGCIYHASSRHRREVTFDNALRGQTRETIQAVQQLWNSSLLPPRTNHRERCGECSMRDICLPDLNIEIHGYFDREVDQ